MCFIFGKGVQQQQQENIACIRCIQNCYHPVRQQHAKMIQID